MTGVRVSALPTATAPGTFYVIEGGVSKKIVLGTAAAVADSTLVHIAGAETVTGVKTFSAATTLITPTALKRLQFENAASSTISDFSTGSVALSFSRASDGILGLSGLFAYTSSGGTYNLALSSRDAVVLATGGGVGYANTLERMRVHGSGNVSIGNTTDAEKLNVTGNVRASGGYQVGTTQVVSTRKTGWAAASGTATRTTFATSTVTTAQLAERVKALLDDLISHGLIGT